MRITADDAVRVAKRGAAGVQKTFDSPDDDWVRVLITVDARGRQDAVAVPSLPSRQQATFLAEQLATPIRRSSAVACALVSSTWVTHLTDGQPMVDNHGEPVREETLIIHAVDRVTEKLLAARIHRHETLPPRLGDWRTWTGRGFPSADGPGSVEVVSDLSVVMRRALTPQG